MVDTIFNPDATFIMLMDGAFRTLLSVAAIAGTAMAIYICYQSLREMNEEYQSSKEELQKMTSKEGL